MESKQARSIIAALGAAGVLTGSALLTGCASSAVAGHGNAASSSAAESSTASAPASAPTSVPTSASPSPGTPNTSSSPASSSGSTVAPPASSGATSSSATAAGFVGTWDGHGRHLEVRGDGTVTVNFRTYVDCTATVTTGCDRVIGHEIHDGGHVLGRITRVINATTVVVTVTSTTDPTAIPAGPVRLGHDLRHHAVALFAGDYSGLPFCGADAPAGYCGA